MSGTARKAPVSGFDWHQRAPGWVLRVMVCVAAAWLVWACSAPGFSFDSMTILLLLFLLGTVWGIRMLIFLHARPAGSPRGRQTWLVPAAVAVCVLLSVTGAGFQLRWALSRPAFDAAVRAHRAGDPAAGRIGLFRIMNIQDRPGGVVFWDSNGDGFDNAGFAWLPQGPGADHGDGSWESPQFSAIGDGWYRWTASW